MTYDHVTKNRPRNYEKFRIPSKRTAQRRLQQNLPRVEYFEEAEDDEILWGLHVGSSEEEASSAGAATSPSKPSLPSSWSRSVRHLFEQFIGQEEEGGLTNNTDIFDASNKNNITAEVTHEDDLNETAIYTTITGDNATNATTNTTDIDDEEEEEENAMDNFLPIRLRVVLAETSGNGHLLLKEERHSLFRDMISPALLSWSNALRVDPVIGNLTVDASQLPDGQTCGPGIDSGLPSAPVPINHIEYGIPDTDIIIYLSLGFAPRPLNVTINQTTSENSTDVEDDDGVEDQEDDGVPRYLNQNNDTEEFSDLGQRTEEVTYNQTQDDLEALRAEAVCSGDYLAAASFCSTDQYDRPTAALLHLCIDEDFFKPENQHRNILSLMHELGHALGFNSLSMAHFRKLDGTPYTKRVDGNIPDTEVECTGPLSERKRGIVALPSEDILQFREVRGGVRVAELVTPSVLQVVRNQFGCQNLTGAELESGETLTLGTIEEGYGCIGDHWERRLFSSDLMNPVIEDLEYYPRISTLTLAYFADSGWYQIDLSGSRVASGWGRGAGCGFVNEACIGKDGQVPRQNAPFFCNQVPDSQAQSTAAQVSACTPDLSRKAVCSMGQYGLDLPWEYRYFQDSYGSNVGGNDPYMDYCPVYAGYDNGLCSNPFTKDFMLASNIERFGERNSRCLVGSLNTNVQQRTALCLPIACVVEDRSLRVKIDQTWHRCEEADQVIVRGIISVLCPDPRRICPTFYCPYDCLGTGGQCDYTDGQCLCEVPGIDQEGAPFFLPCGQELVDQSSSTGSVVMRPNESDQKDELPPPDSPLSDYYVPTERALVERDSPPLENWMIALLGLGSSTMILMVAFVYYRYTHQSERDSIWAQAWLHRTNAQDESSAPVTNDNESRNRNKDKMVATILVDLRIHGNAQGSESLADTEEEMTESEASQGPHSESSSDYSGAQSETLSDMGTTLEDIQEEEIQELQVIRRRRFLGSNR